MVLLLFLCLIVINCHLSVQNIIMTTVTLLWHCDKTHDYSHASWRVLLYSRISLFEAKISTAMYGTYRHQIIFCTHYIIVPDPSPFSMRNNWVNFPAGRGEVIWRREKFDIKSRYNMVCMGVTWGDDDNEWAKKRKIRNSDLWYEKYIYNVCMRKYVYVYEWRECAPGSGEKDYDRVGVRRGRDSRKDARCAFRAFCVWGRGQFIKKHVRPLLPPGGSTASPLCAAAAPLKQWIVSS